MCETLPLRIDGHSVKTLRGKEIPLVKVIWSQANGEYATWERESSMRGSYPHLFETGTSFLEDEKFLSGGGL